MVPIAASGDETGNPGHNGLPRQEQVTRVWLCRACPGRFHLQSGGRGNGSCQICPVRSLGYDDTGTKQSSPQGTLPEPSTHDAVLGRIESNTGQQEVETKEEQRACQLQLGLFLYLSLQSMAELLLPKFPLCFRDPRIPCSEDAVCLA